jgi:predicted SAM-dependent methyltransferase
MENNHYCNACESNISEFLPYGDNKRKNAMCPMCSSLERHRFFKCWFDTIKGNLNTSTRILHFAPEKAIAARFKEVSKKNYVSADILPNKAMKVEDIRQLSFHRNSFDFIFCSHVLQHVNEDEKAISELYRVLDKNGMMVLMGSHGHIKTYTTMHTSDGGVEYFIRHYNTEELINKLTTAGFSVNLFSVESLLKNSEELFRLGIKNGDVVFICSKN